MSPNVTPQVHHGMSAAREILRLSQQDLTTLDATGASEGSVSQSTLLLPQQPEAPPPAAVSQHEQQDAFPDLPVPLTPFNADAHSSAVTGQAGEERVRGQGLLYKTGWSPAMLRAETMRCVSSGAAEVPLADARKSTGEVTLLNWLASRGSASTVSTKDSAVSDLGCGSKQRPSVTRKKPPSYLTLRLKGASEGVSDVLARVDTKMPTLNR